MEAIVCTLKLNNHPIDFQVIYRIPNTSVLEFCSEFMDSIECNIMTTHNKPLLLGDFNIHVDHTDHHDTVTFLDMLDSLNLRNQVAFLTHLSGHTLDLVLDDIVSPIVTSVTKGHMMSDHCFTDCMVAVTGTEPMKLTTIKTRKLKVIDMSAFKSDITNITLKSTDLHRMVMEYNTHLQELLNTYAPEVEKTVLKREMQPWFSDKIRHEIQVQRAKERQWLRNPTDYNLQVFYNQSHFVSNIIRKAQEDNYHSILENNKSDFKVVCKITNSLLFYNDPSPLPPIKNSKALANEFNQFFKDKVQMIMDNLAPTEDNQTDQQYLELDYTTDKRFREFIPVNSEKIVKIIRTEPPKSCDLDPVPSKILKQVCEDISPLIATIDNTSLTSGVFSGNLKNALLRPLLKKATLEVTVLKDFRPVSNLSYLSKLIERVACKQLTDFTAQSGNLEDYQSAYRQGHLTETALLKVKDDILAAIDNQEVMCLVLLDLSAAFDTILHSLLLN